MARRRKEVATLDTVEAVEAEPVIAAAQIEEAPAAAAVEPAPAAPAKWVVLEDKVVSLFGQVTTLPAGTLVSAASYGPIGLKRIMEQGVKLEPVA